MRVPPGLSEGGSHQGTRSNKLKGSSPFSTLRPPAPVHWSSRRHRPPPPPGRACEGGTLTEVWGMPEKARRVLQATAVEAYGRPGMYVVMAQVMRRADISDPEEFRAIAEYLEQRGWIGEADPDYGVFVLTPEGIDEATN